MKISASIFAGDKKPVSELARELSDYGIDLLHIDCDDDPEVLEVIPELRKVSGLPIDLHLISSEPEKYFPKIESLAIEYATIQLETPGKIVSIASWHQYFLGDFHCF